jgi:hypothetical protein
LRLSAPPNLKSVFLQEVYWRSHYLKGTEPIQARNEKEAQKKCQEVASEYGGFDSLRLGISKCCNRT